MGNFLGHPAGFEIFDFLTTLVTVVGKQKLRSGNVKPLVQRKIINLYILSSAKQTGAKKLNRQLLTFYCASYTLSRIFFPPESNRHQTLILNRSRKELSENVYFYPSPTFRF